jgi:hypothetical protein
MENKCKAFYEIYRTELIKLMINYKPELRLNFM